MQEELINRVSSRAGISQDQAQTAVDTVLDFARQRLPEPVVNQLENALRGGGGSSGGGLGDIGKTLGL